jgi:hypothetical protein
MSGDGPYTLIDNEEAGLELDGRGHVVLVMCSKDDYLIDEPLARLVTRRIKSGCPEEPEELDSLKIIAAELRRCLKRIDTAIAVGEGASGRKKTRQRA